MMWNEFAEINENFIDMTPTQMVKYFDDNPMEQTEEILNLWARNYPNAGAGESGLVSRVAEKYNVESDTIFALVEVHGGVGEAILSLGDGFTQGDRNITVADVYTALNGEDMDSVFSMIMECFDNVNAMGKKWIAAFLLKETRNRCGETVVKKMMIKTYGIPANDMKKASSFLSIDDVINQAVNNNALVYVPIAGNYMKPMLAKTGKYTRGKRWCDYKYDGIRAQVHQNEDGIKIFNRKGDDITNKFANDLIPVISECADPVDWIVDGEIYPIDTDGNPAEFKNIMSRIHGKTDEVIYRNAVTIRLFDCLMYGGQPVFEDDLDTRLQTLQMHFDESIVAKTTEINNKEEMLEFYNEAIEAGFEGVIIKDPNLSYEFGKRSKGWEKYKPPLVDVDCIVTGAHIGTGKRKGVYGAYDISIKDGEELISLGKVGSGFTDEDLIFLSHQYDAQGAGNLIIEVKGDMLTQNESGEYGLRFPRYVKFRDDKEEPTQLNQILE